MTNEELAALVRDGFARMDGRFDQINGRVRDVEVKAAVLKERIDTMRGDLHNETRSRAVRWGSVAALGIAALVKAVALLFGLKF